MWRGEDVKMRRCEDEKMWKWDPHYWKNPALRRSREKDKSPQKLANIYICHTMYSRASACQSTLYTCINEQPCESACACFWLYMYVCFARTTKWRLVLPAFVFSWRFCLKKACRDGCLPGFVCQVLQFVRAFTNTWTSALPKLLRCRPKFMLASPQISTKTRLDTQGKICH